MHVTKKALHQDCSSRRTCSLLPKRMNCQPFSTPGVPDLSDAGCHRQAPHAAVYWHDAFESYQLTPAHPIPKNPPVSGRVRRTWWALTLLNGARSRDRIRPGNWVWLVLWYSSLWCGSGPFPSRPEPPRCAARAGAGQTLGPVALQYPHQALVAEIVRPTMSCWPPPLVIRSVIAK